MVFVAALRKINPRDKYRTAAKVLEAWASAEPPRQAPACPLAVACGLAVAAVLAGQPVVGTVFFLCQTGLLRISEPLRMVRRDLVLLDTSAVLILGITKRGVEQRVTLTRPT
eukprot:8116464-Lingulodinium_polyedra.AAC.1